MSDIRVVEGSTGEEQIRAVRLRGLLADSPLPSSELLSNLGLYLRRQTLSRILFMNELYQMIVPVHGVVIEFGVRWGQNLALFSTLRGIYEPFNYNRRLIGFDSWAGFPSVDVKDGPAVSMGDYGVSADYLEHLNDGFEVHEADSPIAHKRKFELVRGDATATFAEFLDANPQTIVALAYFDFDLYAPTGACLELLLPRVTRGSVIAFAS